MRNSVLVLFVVTFGLPLCSTSSAQTKVPPQQLERWLRRFPEADANRDGQLSLEEANAYRRKLQSADDKQRRPTGRREGAPREFKVDPGWDLDRFPADAVCYKTPDEIKAIYQNVAGNKVAVVSYDKPDDGALRIVGTGHSFMAPGYRTFPLICKTAGFGQPLYTHTGGGITGSARYKWEQENGIFQFAGQPTPKLLASIANADWEVMMWGPYFNDRPAYYACWIDFCLKYHPDMKFYLSDAWPQLYQLGKNPESEEFFTPEVFDRMGAEKRSIYSDIVTSLRAKYPGKVYILPTSDAMVLAAKYFLRGELPDIDGIHRVIGKQERSLWRDQLGHLGPGFENLEGYVFYATIYGRSPELIEGDLQSGGDGEFPSRRLDRTFRKIAWQAVIGHPLSGVTDRDRDGVHDSAPHVNP